MKNHAWRGFAGSTHRMSDSDSGAASSWMRIAALSLVLSLPLFVATSPARSQSGMSFEAMQAALKGAPAPSAAAQDDDPISALAAYIKASSPAQSPHGVAAAENAPFDYAAHLNAEQPQLISAEQAPHALPGDSAIAALAAFAAEIEARDPSIKFAEAKTKPVKATKAPAKGATDDEATFVGQQVCLGCHTSQAAAFNQTTMGRIFRNPRTAQEKGGCETCHGAGSLHVKAGGGRGVGGIISFRKNDTTRTNAENNAICLSCHDKGDRNYWQGSVHEARDVACTDCHTVMARVSVRGQLKTEREVDTCYQCHKDRRVQAQRSSHMPLREGKLTCTNCHNPHGSASDAMLKEASVNDNCYKCHAEKRGPFLWEHPPVRENCLNCHEAHGSNLEYLLKVQRPRLCQDCHSVGHPSQSPLVNTAFNRSCNNCHSQIHGSNHPSGVLFQR
jgi:DmsE family decaheme c-type cytochrome